jgi:N-acyl homoserine lactone hydrolase
VTGVLRLTPLEIGRLDTDLTGLTGAPGRVVLPVPSWAIEHPAGLVLFDAGLHRHLQTDPSRVGQVMRDTVVDFRTGEELPARLAAAGYDAADVTVAVISHLHFDHVGGVADLPNARLVVQAAEWRAGHHPRLVEAGVYDPAEFDVGHETELVDGEHDVFGDGTIVSIPTPGHTKGHQALRVELASGPVVLTGDCIYFEAMLDDMRTPVFAYDHDLQLASMRRLAALRDDGCRLLFGHDHDQFRALPAAGWS